MNNFLFGDEEERRKAELREKYVIEMNSAKAAGRKIGLEIGIQQGKEEGIEQGIKEGKEQGIKEGKEQGIKEGKEQGIEETKKQDILKLKAKNWSLEEIAEFVEMSVEDVKNIIDNI